MSSACLGVIARPLMQVHDDSTAARITRGLDLVCPYAPAWALAMAEMGREGLRVREPQQSAAGPIPLIPAGCCHACVDGFPSAQDIIVRRTNLYSLNPPA